MSLLLPERERTAPVSIYQMGKSQVTKFIRISRRLLLSRAVSIAVAYLLQSAAY